jgi:protein-S-isoprenylcysteine O-methyltransferase Ste14
VVLFVLTTVATVFAIGFYLVTLLGIIRTGKLTGRNPVIIFRTGSAEEISALIAFWLFPLALITSTLWPEMGMFRPFLDAPALRLLGAVLLLSGLALQYVSIVTLGRAFTIGLDPSQQKYLVRHGPYQYVRHPIYAAFLGYFIGAWLLQPNLFFSIAMPAAITRVVAQAIKEEQLLLTTFGAEYRSYMASTRRFIPWIG